jgi:hypothetical protein
MGYRVAEIAGIKAIEMLGIAIALWGGLAGDIVEKCHFKLPGDPTSSS